MAVCCEQGKQEDRFEDQGELQQVIFGFSTYTVCKIAWQVYSSRAFTLPGYVGLPQLCKTMRGGEEGKQGGGELTCKQAAAGISQMRTVPSMEALSSHFASWLTTSPVMRSLCPLNSRTCRKASTSYLHHHKPSGTSATNACPPASQAARTVTQLPG